MYIRLAEGATGLNYKLHCKRVQGRRTALPHIRFHELVAGYTQRMYRRGLYDRGRRRVSALYELLRVNKSPDSTTLNIHLFSNILHRHLGASLILYHIQFAYKIEDFKKIVMQNFFFCQHILCCQFTYKFSPFWVYKQWSKLNLISQNTFTTFTRMILK